MGNNTAITADNRFAIIPHWVIYSNISDAALRLYAVMAKYADNATGKAWPSRGTLANDIRKSEKTVDRAIKELVEAGALKVSRRYDPETREYKSNMYTLITAMPTVGVASPVSPPTPTNVPLTKPTELDPYSFTSDLRSDESFHVRGNLEPAKRKHLVDLIHTIGLHRKAGNEWWDEPVQDVWGTFLTDFETCMGDDYHDGYGHLLANTWTISAACANRYQAGAELNKMIATGALV